MTAVGKADSVVATAEVESADDNIAESETTADNVGATFAKPNSFLSSEKSGKNRVHQNAILILLLIMRCWRMNRTTRRKKTNADMMSIRSSQSVFSRALTSFLEVPIKSVSLSCADDVAFREALDASLVGLV